MWNAGKEQKEALWRLEKLQLEGSQQQGDEMRTRTRKLTTSDRKREQKEHVKLKEGTDGASLAIGNQSARSTSNRMKEGGEQKDERESKKCTLPEAEERAELA